ncbi:hypothetical protein DAI22_06g042500 [Oryza sativa Japonica Group]|nr:hypothetical protein DAI22_06g042500 [Oryza sativa Japonica Group]
MACFGNVSMPTLARADGATSRTRAGRASETDGARDATSGHATAPARRRRRHLGRSRESRHRTFVRALPSARHPPRRAAPRRDATRATYNKHHPRARAPSASSRRLRCSLASTHECDGGEEEGGHDWEGVWLAQEGGEKKKKKRKEKKLFLGSRALES